MESRHKTREELAEQWEALTQKNWQCVAQKRFGTTYVAPMLAELDGLNRATDHLLTLCQEAESAAGAIRDPNEDDQ